MMGALPKSLARRGHRVMVVAPRYANYEEAWDTSVRITVNAAGSNVEVGIPQLLLMPCYGALSRLQHQQSYRRGASGM